MQPTPIPTTNEVIQLLQSMQKSYDATATQGQTGVLLLIGLGVVLFVFYLILKTWVTRNQKVQVAESPQAIIAIAGVVDTQTEAIKQSDKEHRELMERMSVDTNNKMAAFTNAITQNNALLTAINEGNKAQTNIHTGIQADLHQMAVEGSKPLQELIITAARIEKLMNEIRSSLLPCEEIRTLRDEDRQLLKSLLEAILLDARLLESSTRAHIEDKRSTGTQAVVIVPEQPLKVDTSNLLSGDEAATKPEAA